MPVTKDQAQMLTTLAIACRPHRAPTWDQAGVMAAIAKVHDRALPEVILAVVRAAADREVISPGVIPSNGSHWQEQLKPPKTQPDAWDPADVCTVCSLPRTRCERPRAGDDDHEFISRARNAQTVTAAGYDTERIVTEMKRDKEPTA